MGTDKDPLRFTLPVTVGRVSEVWVDQLAQMGTDMPRHGMRDIWHSWQDARFPGQEPAEPRPPT